MGQADFGVDDGNGSARIIAKEVIKALGLAGAVAGVLVAPNAATLVDTFLKNLDKRSARKTISYLKYRKLVEVKQVGGNYEYKLTKKGVDKFKRLSLDDMTIPKPLQWDGKWRMVLFDIPAEHHAARHAFLEKLKSLHFYMIQKSAWIHPFDCEREIGALLEAYNLEDHVSFLVVSESNFSEYATKHFKRIGLLD